MHLLDYLLLLLIAAAIVAAVLAVWRAHKQGYCIGCKGDCATCGRGCKERPPQK